MQNIFVKFEGAGQRIGAMPGVTVFPKIFFITLPRHADLLFCTIAVFFTRGKKCFIPL